MGSEAIRTIKGREYRYFIYYESGKKKTTYCGLASDPKSKHRMILLELEEYKNRQKEVTKKITELEVKLIK